jgi:hypothetical protein
MLSKFLSSRGFTENPFASTNADKEPNLASYFVPPPYFTSVKGDPQHPKSNVVLAPRGGGKTAQKVMLEDYAEGERDNPFYCITYDSFRSIPRARLSTVNVEWHLNQVIQRLLSGILALIQAGQKPELSTSDKRLLAYCFQQYLGTISAADADNIFASVKTNTDKVLDFVRANKQNIARIVAAIPTIWGLQPLDIESTVKELREEPALYIIERLVEVIRKFGFCSVYVLVDRIDEVTEFSNDASACARFVQPLLTELNLLELDGLAFKVFLWDQMEDYLTEAGFRSDRVLVHHLKWSTANLEEMLSRRLSAYSNGAITSVNQLIPPDATLDVHRLVCLLSAGSPRDVIRLVGRIIDEHTRTDDTDDPLGWGQIDRGIRKYSRERSLELYGVDKVEDLSKIGMVSFSIGEVANDIFRISHQAARNKIQNMMNVAAVIKSGDIENPGNRPLHQYSIIDPRLAAVVMSSYTIEDVLRYYLFMCPRCSIVLAREGKEATCHECSLDFQLDDDVSVLTDCFKKR